MALPLFAVTLFVSAFVLFLVQPMVGKMILPKLGGTPQVWNTCMVFFQSALLAGYAYSHWLSTRLPLRKQLLVHAAVLLVPIIVLIPPIGPFNIVNWVPPPGSNPIFATLRLLAVIVGLPFLAVSTTAPLLQKWFSRTGHPTAGDPYYLYSASNIGSLLSLAAYPFFVEPLIDLPTQKVVWTVFYLVLVVFILACAYSLWKTPGALDLPILAPETPTAETPVPPLEDPKPEIAPSTAIKAGPAPGASKTGFQKKKGPALAKPREAARTVAPAIDYTTPSDAPVTPWRRLRWVLLAAVPSSLMLGVTAYVSVDLSPFPLLWAIPLSLYLISFILVFARWPVPWVGTPHQVVLFLQPIGVLAMVLTLLSRSHGSYVQPMIASFLGFFLTALALHGELARDRPSAKHLTEFFLLMSLGGMIGGFFNGIVAPLIFTGVVEYPLAILLACFLRPVVSPHGWTEGFLMKQFPQSEAWAVEQGDKLSESFRAKPRHTPWLLSWIFDVILGVGAVVIAYLIVRMLFGAPQFPGQAVDDPRYYNPTIFSFMKTLGLYPSEGEPNFIYTRHSWYNIVGTAVFYVIPLMVMLFLFAVRPFRFGLGVFTMLFLYVGFLGLQERERTLPGGARRSYFGVLRVFENEAKRLNAISERGDRYLRDQLRDPEMVVMRGGEIDPEATRNILGVEFPVKGEEGMLSARSTSLTHGTTHHGENYHYPPGLRRLATTYYHRLGPVGAIMERYNWFQTEQRRAEFKMSAAERAKLDKERPTGQYRYTADARLPAAMVAQGFAALNAGLPVEQIANAWSEPPYATIGLGTGTMASYGRPYQHVTFYEIDDEIRKFSEPFTFATDEIPTDQKGWDEKIGMDPDAKLIRRPYFNYLHDAALRGAAVEVVMGDARTSMEHEDHPGRISTGPYFPLRKHYYKVIEVDAFSSDAIPIHLITKEAIQLYIDHITDDGVVMVHTSNRHVDLVQPVVNIAQELKLDWRVGNDVAIPARRKGIDQYALGFTNSEYVMLAKKPGILRDLYKLPGESTAAYERQVWDPDLQPVRRSLVGWYKPPPPDHRLWTDDYTNILQIYR